MIKEVFQNLIFQTVEADFCYLKPTVRNTSRDCLTKTIKKNQNAKTAIMDNDAAWKIKSKEIIELTQITESMEHGC